MQTSEICYKQTQLALSVKILNLNLFLFESNIKRPEKHAQFIRHTTFDQFALPLANFT